MKIENQSKASKICRRSLWLICLLTIAFSSSAEAMGKKKPSPMFSIASCDRHLAVPLLPPPSSPPSSVSPQDPIASIGFLWPSLSRNQLELKLKNSSLDELQFFRSTAPLFYYLASQSTTELKNFDDLFRFSGTIIGDAHPENFGSIVVANDRAIYTANDVDDSTQAPIAIDLLRYLTAVRLIRPDAHIDGIIDAYIKGLRNESHPKTLRDSLVFDSLQKGALPDKSDIDLKNDLFKRNSTEITEASQDESKIYCALALHHLSGSRCIDSVHVERQSGGSAFVPRTWVLIETPKGKIHVEFKSQLGSSLEAWFSKNASINQAQRIESAIKLTMGAARTNDFQAILSNQFTSLMRPRYAGNSSYKMDKLNPSQQISLFQEQAHQMGLIHAQNFKNTNKYEKAIQNVPVQKWNEITFKLGKELKQWQTYIQSIYP